MTATTKFNHSSAIHVKISNQTAKIDSRRNKDIIGRNDITRNSAREGNTYIQTHITLTESTYGIFVL